MARKVVVAFEMNCIPNPVQEILWWLLHNVTGSRQILPILLQ
jgi:hypothetical protein